MRSIKTKKMKHFYNLKSALTLLLIVVSSSLFAQSGKISIQGILKNFNGTVATDGSYDMEFNIYTAPSGGSAIWTETQSGVNAVSVLSGVYNTQLGKTSAGLTALQGLSFDVPYYLGIKVLTGANPLEMTPRIELAYGVKTLHSNSANSANFADSSSVANMAYTAYGVQFDGGGISDANGNLYLQGNPGNVIINGSGILEVQNGSIVLGADAANPAIWDDGTNLHIEGHDNTTSRTVMENSIEIHPKTTNGYLTLGVSSSRSYINAYNGNMFLKAETGNIIANSAIEANGTTSLGSATYACYYYNGSAAANVQTVSNNFSFTSANNIRANGFFAVSDKRVKKDFELADGNTSIGLISNLKITKYKYIDESKGQQEVLGIVAQEVKEVLPNAINYSKSYIPSIYANASNVYQEESTTVVIMEKDHGLKIGDKVKVITKEKSLNLEVLAVNGNSFSIEKVENCPENLFVYGKEIEDFHNVDFNQLTSLSLSAIQELIKQNNALKLELDNTKAELEQTKEKQNDELKSILLRIQNLENSSNAADTVNN